MLHDPGLRCLFGGERADLRWIAARDGDLDGKGGVVKRDHPVGRLLMGMGFWHGLARSRAHVRKRQRQSVSPLPQNRGFTTASGRWSFSLGVTFGGMADIAFLLLSQDRASWSSRTTRS